MKNKNQSIVRSYKSIGRRLREVQRGQSMVVIALTVVAIIAAAGLAIDCGRLYYAQQELTASTQAAALAGGAALSTAPATDTAAEAQTYAQNQATQYSGVTGDLNVSPSLPNVTMVSGYPSAGCLAQSQDSLLALCSAQLSGDNAITVGEQVTVPMTFLRVLGFKTLTLTSYATASARGGSGGPYNVAIVLDTTKSMTDTDSSPQCSNTRISCALTGIRALLLALSPCAGGLSATNCGNTVTSALVTMAGPEVGNETAYNVTNPVDEVSLMVFPGLSSVSPYVADDTACPNKLPSSGAITSYNNAPVYQIVPASSDYLTADGASSLNASAKSGIVNAVGGGSCSGVSAPGGEGTFYAGIIDQAQAQLVATQSARLSKGVHTKNVMIILSDGAANATAAQMSNKTTPYPPTNECQQAITEAQAATAAHTTVYTVAYGAEPTGCTTDASLSPCQTMEEMASTWNASNPSANTDFFSDYTATGGDPTCTSAARPTTSLSGIFTQIAADLTVSRLIPSNLKVPPQS
ncbi:MAG: pilus assembly protein TadG-related protein [Candidatus Binataceae bacterium]|jgi:Flp pilus assembly protein TadG